MRLHYKKQLEFHRPLIQPGSLVFDIGAHYGGKATIFAELGARVIALEPTPACLDGLRYHHGSNPSVTIVPKAVSDSVGKATIFVGDSLAVSSLRPEWFTFMEKSKVGIEVPTTTLDELISQYGRPDFCKIDVEGCELQVFRGLSQPIPLVAFEFMTEELELTRTCLAELARLGTISCNASPMEEMCFMYPDWTDPDTLIARLKAEPGLQMGDIFVRCA